MIDENCSLCMVVFSALDILLTEHGYPRSSAERAEVCDRLTITVHVPAECTGHASISYILDGVLNHNGRLWQESWQIHLHTQGIVVFLLFCSFGTLIRL